MLPVLNREKNMDEIIAGIAKSDPDNELFGLVASGTPTVYRVEDQDGHEIVAADDPMTLTQAIRLLNALGIKVTL